MTRRKRIATLIVALAVLVCGAVLWNFDQPPRAVLRVQDVPARSSKAHIARLLGEPATISDDGRTFVYTRPLSWGILYVYFDRHETLTHYRYDRWPVPGILFSLPRFRLHHLPRPG